MNEDRHWFNTPIAIVIAGALVALGIYMHQTNRYVFVGSVMDSRIVERHDTITGKVEVCHSPNWFRGLKVVEAEAFISVCRR